MSRGSRTFAVSPGKGRSGVTIGKNGRIRGAGGRSGG